MIKNLLIFLITAFILHSCFKEELNQQPRILSYEISQEQPNPGDTITINITTEDMDGDPVTYAWKSDYGTFITDTELSSVQWIVPFIEGTNYPSVELSDGKVDHDEKIPVECTAYINDDFSVNFNNKDTSNTFITWSENKCTIKAQTYGSDYKFYEVPNVAIEPPYAVYIDINTVYSIPFFSPTDKYGVYLDFWNVGADTLIKGLWFRIYPTSDSKIWTINVLKDNGSSSTWEEIANYTMGTGNLVSKQTGVVNRLKFVVEADHSLQVYNNDELLIATNILVENYTITNVPPGLKLQKAGIRGSGGSVTIDNLLITHNTELLSSDLFTE